MKKLLILFLCLFACVAQADIRYLVIDTATGEIGTNYPSVIIWRGIAFTSLLYVASDKFDDGGSGRVNIDDTLYSTNGNIGIGANAPQQKLHVNGNVILTGQQFPKVEIIGSVQGSLVLKDSGATLNRGTVQFVSIADVSKFRALTDVGGIGIDNMMVFDHSNGRIGIAEATPSTILDVVAGSATDPVADSWDNHPSGRFEKDVIGSAPTITVTNIPTYRWTWKAKVSTEEASERLGTNTAWTAQQIEDRRLEMLAVKSALPKYTTERIGIMIGDPQIPDAILNFDDAGKRTGISGIGFKGYMFAIIRQQQIAIEELKERLLKLE